MSEINLGMAPPETVLAPNSEALATSLAAAVAAPIESRREAVADVVAKWPAEPAVWAALGDAGRDAVESYSAYRVGYHRGLDSLRKSGWRGSGYVRWRHETNRGFLSALEGLRRCADAIGEGDEVERIGLFLRQLDPDWPPTPSPFDL